MPQQARACDDVDVSLEHLTIRTARSADADVIAGIHRLARRVAMPFLPELHGEADTRASVASCVLPSCAVWVAEREGRVVGYAALADQVLEHLYVEPDSQGQGVGSALLARAQLESPERLELWTFQRNVQARRCYEQRGFRAVELTNGAGERGARA